MTLFSYSISHNFPALKLWNEKSEAMVKINRVPKKASIRAIKGDIFVSSEIRRMKGNLHTPILIKVAPVNHGLQCTMVNPFVAESLVLFTFIEIMETICEKAIT